MVCGVHAQHRAQSNCAVNYRYHTIESFFLSFKELNEVSQYPGIFHLPRYLPVLNSIDRS